MLWFYTNLNRFSANLYYLRLKCQNIQTSSQTVSIPSSERSVSGRRRNQATQGVWGEMIARTKQAARGLLSRAPSLPSSLHPSPDKKVHTEHSNKCAYDYKGLKQPCRQFNQLVSCFLRCTSEAFIDFLTKTQKLKKNLLTSLILYFNSFSCLFHSPIISLWVAAIDNFYFKCLRVNESHKVSLSALCQDWPSQVSAYSGAGQRVCV